VLVSLILLLTGAAILGYGVYLRISDKYKQTFIVLPSTSTGNVNLHVPRYDVILLAVGGALLLASILALISLSKNCVGVTFRVTYGLLAVVMLAAMVLVAALFFYVLSLQGKTSFKNDVEKVWLGAVQANATDICTFESKFKCRGFNDNECTNCQLGTESTCTSTQKTRCAACDDKKNDFTGNGCFNEFRDVLRIESIVIGAVCSVIALMLLIDLFVLCAL
jgi:Tetraspanin family